MQITTGTTYEIWQIPDSGSTTAAAGASTTSFTDAYRTEAADFWVDYWAVPYTGSIVNQVSRVSDSTALGVFTVATAFT